MLVFKNLSSLDLSWSGLELTSPSLGDLLRSLSKLEELNLSGVDISSFLVNEIPSNLSSLRSINLSFCGLQGHVPSSFFSSNLRSLDLSANFELHLTSPTLGELLRHTTMLEKLDLSEVNISSPLVIPKNLSSLTSLLLPNCGLHGDIPSSIFDLPNLQVLHMGGNSLSGPLPKFSSKSPLKSIILDRNNLSGWIPASVANLSSLQVIMLSNNALSGPLPEFHSNSRLESLYLDSNNFSGGIPASIINVSSLRYLDLRNNSLSGSLPKFPFNSRLESLSLDENSLSGEIPASIGNLTQLIYLGMSLNRFHGPIPSIADGNQVQTLILSQNQFNGSLLPSLGNLFRLRYIDLRANDLSDKLPTQLLNLSQLYSIDLSFNRLSESDSDITASQNLTELHELYLTSCSLRSFPRILQKLNFLSYLDLSFNDIPGEVPMWFQEVATDNLLNLNLSYNSLTGFAGNTSTLRWKNLLTLDLQSNELQGPLPMPLESIRIYRASDNALSGEIPPVICNRSNINWLELGNNNLTGEIPRCFASLTVLSLRGNSLNGGIPELTADNVCSLEMLDLSVNRLEGPLPKSLSRCNQLEFLNLGDNMIEDSFPFWLGAITPLKILILRSNKFYGSIVKSKADPDFPSMQIIDLSKNSFEGPLPAEYFQFWTSMRLSNVTGERYVWSVVPISKTSAPIYEYTMSIMNKGMEMDYPKILNDFQMIDFSSNNFSGYIPSSIAALTGLRLLNFSNNILSGPIPPTLQDLKNLEALDLSKNMFTGEIPEQLTELTFLAFFDVSENNLSGHIPQGKQFDSFKNTSYEGNDRLCGIPLSRTCGVPSTERARPPSPTQQLDHDGSFIIEWKAVAVGYIGAFVIAVVIGHKIITVESSRYIEALELSERIRRVVIQISFASKA